MEVNQKSSNPTEPEDTSKEGLAIIELGNQINQYAALFGTRMAGIEAQLHVTQDLLKTILVQQGSSRETLDQDCLNAFKEYENNIALSYADKLKEFQEYLTEIEYKPKKDTLYQFAIKLAEVSEHSDYPWINLGDILKEVNDPQLTEAVNEIIKQVGNGLLYSQAFATRPDVFSSEFIRAIKASDADNNIAKHLRIFLKYREI